MVLNWIRAAIDLPKQFIMSMLETPVPGATPPHFPAVHSKACPQSRSPVTTDYYGILTTLASDIPAFEGLESVLRMQIDICIRNRTFGALSQLPIVFGLWERQTIQDRVWNSYIEDEFLPYMCRVEHIERNQEYLRLPSL